MKVFLSNEYRIHSDVARIEAALGVLYSKHNSPNTSPETYFFKKVVSVFPFKLIFFLLFFYLDISLFFDEYKYAFKLPEKTLKQSNVPL